MTRDSASIINATLRGDAPLDDAFVAALAGITGRSQPEVRVVLRGALRAAGVNATSYEIRTGAWRLDLKAAAVKAISAGAFSALVLHALGEHSIPAEVLAIVAPLIFEINRVEVTAEDAWVHARLAHRKLRICDAKTEAGVREVDMTPRLHDELARYLATRGDAGPGDPAFPTRTGARRDKDNIRQRVVAPALRRANGERAAAGLPPIAVNVTPHTLRRTYISLMLAAGADVPYVQAQVGHADAKVTLEIYALVLKRRNRTQFAEAFDGLMRDSVPSSGAAKMPTDGKPATPDRPLVAA